MCSLVVKPHLRLLYLLPLILGEDGPHFIVCLSQQQSPPGDRVSLKHQLLKVVVRVAQYRMILTGESRGAERGFTNPQ